MEYIRPNILYFTDNINVNGLRLELSHPTRLNILACKSDVQTKAYMVEAQVNLKKQQWDKSKEETKLIALDELNKPDESMSFKTVTMHVDKTGTILIRAWLEGNHEEYVEAEFTL